MTSLNMNILLLTIALLIEHCFATFDTAFYHRFPSKEKNYDGQHQQFWRYNHLYPRMNLNRNGHEQYNWYHQPPLKPLPNYHQRQDADWESPKVFYQDVQYYPEPAQHIKFFNPFSYVKKTWHINTNADRKLEADQTAGFEDAGGDEESKEEQTSESVEVVDSDEFQFLAELNVPETEGVAPAPTVEVESVQLIGNDEKVADYVDLDGDSVWFLDLENVNLESASNEHSTERGEQAPAEMELFNPDKIEMQVESGGEKVEENFNTKWKATKIPNMYFENEEEMIEHTTKCPCHGAVSTQENAIAELKSEDRQDEGEEKGVNQEQNNFFHWKTNFDIDSPNSHYEFMTIAPNVDATSEILKPLKETHLEDAKNKTESVSDVEENDNYRLDIRILNIINDSKTEVESEEFSAEAMNPELNLNVSDAEIRLLETTSSTETSPIGIEVEDQSTVNETDSNESGTGDSMEFVPETEEATVKFPLTNDFVDEGTFPIKDASRTLFESEVENLTPPNIEDPTAQSSETDAAQESSTAVPIGADEMMRHLSELYSIENITEEPESYSYVSTESSVGAATTITAVSDYEAVDQSRTIIEIFEQTTETTSVDTKYVNNSSKEGFETTSTEAPAVQANTMPNDFTEDETRFDLSEDGESDEALTTADRIFLSETSTTSMKPESATTDLANSSPEEDESRYEATDLEAETESSQTETTTEMYEGENTSEAKRNEIIEDDEERLSAVADKIRTGKTRILHQYDVFPNILENQLYPGNDNEIISDSEEYYNQMLSALEAETNANTDDLLQVPDEQRVTTEAPNSVKEQLTTIEETAATEESITTASSLISETSTNKTDLSEERFDGGEEASMENSIDEDDDLDEILKRIDNQFYIDLIPTLIENYRQGVVIEEEERVLAKIFMGLWPLIVEEATRDRENEPMNPLIRKLLEKPRQRNEFDFSDFNIN